MKDKQIRKEILRKMLTINEEFCKKQARQIDSLVHQLEFMIKERNKYKDKYEDNKDKHDDFVSLRKELKIVKRDNVKLSRAYAKKIGVMK